MQGGMTWHTYPPTLSTKGRVNLSPLPLGERVRVRGHERALLRGEKVPNHFPARSESLNPQVLRACRRLGQKRTLGGDA